MISVSIVYDSSQTAFIFELHTYLSEKGQGK